MTFVINLSNVGTTAALGVTLSDPTPSGTTYVSCSASQGSCSGPPVGTGGTVTAALGTVGVGGTASVTIVLQAPTQSAVITNTAVISGSNLPNGDVTVQASLAVGNAAVDIPFLDPKMMVLVTLLLVFVGLRAIRGGQSA